ncbi:STAS domain-containing protein [Rhodococcus tukisamuensis]|uniref:STAS domain-containing protein n=1 Tax=Rhodococcus tukisamuensis TaxID=168276 RepID=UPI0011136515|nr:STAS domain-containing protein [Rhodococcus tukisamuensis]
MTHTASIPTRSPDSDDAEKVAALTAVVAEIDRRLARTGDEEPDRQTVLRDRDRATLYLAATRAGRAELIPEALYRALLARNSSTTSTPETVVTVRERRLAAPHPDRPSYQVPDRGGYCHTTVVTVGGDLESSTLPEFRRVLDHALSTSYHGVVVDLAATTFVSIAVTRELAAATRRADRNRLDLRLVTGSPRLGLMLTTTGTLPLSRCYDSLPSALGG